MTTVRLAHQQYCGKQPLEVASLGKGAQPGAVVYLKQGLERYLGVQIVISDAVLSAGAFDAFLTKDPQTNL